jgi:DNA (cytosine-5)-methyltransferase 1
MVGFETVAFVEQNPYCQSILNKRFQGVPIYEDIREVTAERLRKDGIGKIDGCAGGFPCQGNSMAGKRKGKADERYLWPEMARITCEINARWMVGENVRGILSVDGGELFGDVLRDLAEMGHGVGWSCYGACDVGASHKRERVFILAHSASERRRAGAEVKGTIREMPDNWAVGNKSSRPGETCGVMWPTPTAQDGKNSTLPPSQQDRDSVVGAVMRTGNLWGTHTASGAIRSDKYIRDAITPAEYAKMVGGQLNPDWVECLMGFPIGWTDIECDNPIPWPGNPAFMGQPQYDYEPPRVATGIKNRAKRLKALGNAVYTLQPLPIFKAIAEIEYGRVIS